MASKAAQSAAERAIKYIEKTTRIKLQDLRDNPGARTTGRITTKRHNQAGHTIGELQHAAKPPLGWIWGDFYRPWQRMFPGEKSFNGDINLRREYPPLSLLELQRLIDLGWLNTSTLIDLTALCNTRQYRCNPKLRQFGVQLTDQGADCFEAVVNLEVQWASETAIAAVERAGGRIRTAYYDISSLEAVIDPEKWFKSGLPIPRRKAPPESLLSYYTNPRNRGYLCKKEDLTRAEDELAQLYGYERKLRCETLDEKDPTQIFVGLEPGSLISLADKKVFVPTSEAHRRYYGAEGGKSVLFCDHQYS
ncbi:hypothetical protein AB6A40_004282 [Gnathostoma spinigerum]|uniref:Large ribosomal subunit protein uL15m n=1 Tax=Gnathostoma spinigerum TaxID=75299 RepID=A0ABD6EC15_9BILA